MKVLMFGWEFPPHISGGLGTACYGLTKGLSAFKDVEVLFVVPKSYGDEDQSCLQLIGASDVPITQRKIHFDDIQHKIDYYEVNSKIVPYVEPEEFWKMNTLQHQQSTRFIKTNEEGKLDFSGEYGADLLYEIYKYSLVAETIAKENKFDVIHAHDWLAYPAGIAAKKATGKPLVIHVHATDFDRSGGNVNPRVFAIEKEGMDYADRIITVSNLTRNVVIEKYGIAPEKVVTIYNAVEPLKADWNVRLKKGVNEKIVTFLGRITMQKGPEYFVEAASKVLEKMDNVRFVMAGNGDMMNKMIKRVARLGIADRFHFTGFLKGEDVFDMFGMSDVYVMPSISEPFGISPLEAIQSNVPTIISYQSGVSEILHYTLKVDFWDVNAMADAIYALLNYPALSQILRKYGKDEVENLQWEHSAKKTRDIYLQVIEETGSKGSQIKSESL